MIKKITWMGVTYYPKNWREITDKEYEDFVKLFYEKPPIEDVQNELKKIYNGKNIAAKTVAYYLKDIMAMTKASYMTKWSFHDLLKCKDLVGCFYARFDRNKNVFGADLKTNIGTASHIGGASLAILPPQYKIKDVRYILQKYNVNNNYYDFSCGWGARMLASISEHVNYYGTDPNNLLVERLHQIKELYEKVNNVKVNCDIKCLGSEVFIPEWKNKIGLAFSSPPYFDLEDYKLGKQSYITGKTTYEEWLKNYLEKTIKNIYQYLIDEGYFIMNIKNLPKYKLADDMLNIAENCNFKLIDKEVLNVMIRPNLVKNGKKPHLKNFKDTKHNEDIFVFKKR